MSFTKDYISRLAIWRDDMTDALVLLRSLGPRGPEDAEYARVVAHLRCNIEELDRLTPSPYGLWTGRPDRDLGNPPTERPNHEIGRSPV